VRLTVSPRGISTSVGAGPVRFTIGQQGAAVTARIPGSGIAFRQPVHFGKNAGSPLLSDYEPALIRPAPNGSPIESNYSGQSEIRSASTIALTSSGLEPIKDLIIKAQLERAQLLPELHQAHQLAAQLRARLDRWRNGWLYCRLFKGKYAILQEKADEAAAYETELTEQERQSRMVTAFDLPPGLKDSYGQLIDAASTLGEVQRLWDTISWRQTDQNRERTVAARSVERVQVRAGTGGCELIETRWRVPQLENSNGGELLIYPAFILYRVSTEAFALVDVRETQIVYDTVAFHENEIVPSDSRVIGHTWLKANKDGSPDKRFANNRQIPIAEYGRLRITSGTGLNEEYMVSSAQAAMQFSKAWSEFVMRIPPDSIETMETDATRRVDAPQSEEAMNTDPAQSHSLNRRLVEPDGTESAVDAVSTLIADGALSRESFDRLVAHHGVSESRTFRDHLLDLVLRRVRNTVRDHCITTDELDQIQQLAVTFQVAEGEYYRQRRAEVAEILQRELHRILEDERVDAFELSYLETLQRMFGLGYDQYVELTRDAMTPVVDHAIARATADGLVTSEERADIERRIARLSTVYPLSSSQRHRLGIA